MGPGDASSTSYWPPSPTEANDGEHIPSTKPCSKRKERKSDFRTIKDSVVERSLTQPGDELQRTNNQRRERWQKLDVKIEASENPMKLLENVVGGTRGTRGPCRFRQLA